MREIVVAPFSNNAIRDWPREHFTTLVGLLLGEAATGDRITVVGTRGQRAAANEIVRTYPATRVANAAGLPWPDVLARIKGAACLVGNNSGLTHLARALGVPTICVFGGSHQRTEWGPLGPGSVILTRAIGCSPCQFNHIWECPYDIACLRRIAPADVAAAVRGVMETGRAGDPPADERLQPLQEDAA